MFLYLYIAHWYSIFHAVITKKIVVKLRNDMKIELFI